MMLKNFQKLIAITAIGLLTTILLYFFLLSPNLDKINELFKEASAKKTEHQTLLDQILAYKSSQAELASVTNKDFILNSVLERNKLQVAIVEMEEGALAAGVTEVLSIREELDAKGKPKPTKLIIQGNADIDEVYYTVSVSGSYVSILKFIQYLEHLPHFSEILKITMRATSVNDATGTTAINGDDIIVDIEAIFMVRKVK